MRIVQLWYGQEFHLHEIDHVGKLVLAESGHERIDDGPDPKGRQRDHRELPPMGATARSDIARTMPRRQARDNHISAAWFRLVSHPADARMAFPIARPVRHIKSPNAGGANRASS